MNSADNNQAPDHDEILDYLAGRLDGAQSQAFEARMASDSSLRDKVEEERALNSILDRYAAIVPTQASENRALARLERKIKAGKPAGRLYRIGWAAGIAAALVLGAFVVFTPSGKETSNPNNEHLANKADEQPAPNGVTYFNLDEIDYLGVTSEENGEIEDSRRSRHAELIAKIEMALAGFDKDLVKASLDPSFHNLKLYRGHESLWRDVAARFNPLDAEAFSGAAEKVKVRLEAMRKAFTKHSDRRIDGDKPERKRDGRRGGEDRRKKSDSKRGVSNADRIARLMWRVPPEKHDAFLDAFKQKLASVNKADLEKARKEIKELRSSDDLQTRLAFAIVGEWRAAQGWRSEPDLPKNAEKVAVLVNEMAAARILFMASMRRGGNGQAVVADTPEALAERYRTHLKRMADRGPDELGQKLEALNMEELSGLIKDTQVVTLLAGIRSKHGPYMVGTLLRHRLSGGEEGANVLDPQTFDLEKRKEGSRKDRSVRPSRGEGRPRGPRGKRGDRPGPGPRPEDRRGPDRD